MVDKTIPYTIVVPTTYGTMLLNRYDINQTNSLIKTGFGVDHSEIVLISKIIDILTGIGKKIFVDIGANIGTHTIGIARHFGDEGLVFSFEPQRILFQMICGSAAMNSLGNIHCYNLAIGSSAGSIDVPNFDYFKEMNFGSIEFGAEQVEPLHQVRGSGRGSPEKVIQVTLDSFGFPEIHVLKVDVEGMEFDVLDGASETIRRCNPVMMIEYIKVDKAKIADKIKAMDYVIYDIWPNFLSVPRNIVTKINVGLPEF